MVAQRSKGKIIQFDFLHLVEPEPVRIIEAPDMRTVTALHNMISALPFDFALFYRDWRLTHRSPLGYWSKPLKQSGMMPRNFYVLQDCTGRIVGLEHYQPFPASWERVQRGIALVLAARGWQTKDIQKRAVADNWLTEAHRLPRLLKK